MATRWRRSLRSTNNQNCVELAHTLDAIRDSKNPAGPVLSVSSVKVLLAAVKAGKFD